MPYDFSNLPPYSGWTNISVDGIVNEGVTLLHGIHMTAGSTAGHAELYEGLDTVSGRFLIHVDAGANATKDIQFDPPLLLERGLYADLVANVVSMLVAFTPVRGA